MSFRLPRGPKLVTLFHDSQSSSSQRVLNILQSRSKPATELLRDQNKNSSSNGEEPSRVKQYLKEAATGNVDQEPAFELEIVERSKATMDQWKVIASYLEKTKNELKQSKIEALKDEQGPIVIDWDDGVAVQSEDEVKQLVDQLVEKNASLTGKGGGNGCIIV